MSEDIVKRLRGESKWAPSMRDDMRNAADEIERLRAQAEHYRSQLDLVASTVERLRAENAKLREALTDIAGMLRVNSAEAALQCVQIFARSVLESTS